MDMSSEDISARRPRVELAGRRFGGRAKKKRFMDVKRET